MLAETTSVIQGHVVDSQGLALAGAEIVVSSPSLIGQITIASDLAGAYRAPGLQPGAYNLQAGRAGFSTKRYEGLIVTVNSVMNFDIALDVTAIQETVTVSATAPQLDSGVSSSGATILPQQIEQMPINGRNYLDLMELIPGVTVNRQVDAGTDAATAILGERGGNAAFLIDGMPNNNRLDGGPASLFNQDSILEFQVLTSGYKAEFGNASGGIVNVVTKSGTRQWHGLVSAFYRNDALNSSDVPQAAVPYLRRWDLGANLGGALVKDRVFFFGSIERIRESRQLNFQFPVGIPDFLQTREETFDHHSQTFDTRSFLKLDAQLARHRITGQMNLSSEHITDFLPLSQATNLPSTRTNLDSRSLMLGFHDTATLGDRTNPLLMTAYIQYLGEPSNKRATYPDASPATTAFNMFSSLTTGRLSGDLGQVRFGAGFTPLILEQKSTSTGIHFDRVFGRHQVKFGWDFERTRADGSEASNVLNQLFATVSDFAQFGPVTSGVYTLRKVGGLTDADNLIRVRNNYNGVFVQDDWRIAKTLTPNLGLRWDHDTRFPNLANFSPRVGAAWSPTAKTVVKASWGIFYDHFRLGVARDVPALGGANLVTDQTISFPRLFYGDPTSFPRSNGVCHSPVLTDAQVAAAGAACADPSLPLFGVDHLNKIAAPGHSGVPPNTVVSVDNVQALTGLSPQRFADAASSALGHQPGFFFWGGFGHLSMNFLIPQIFSIPITVDPGFTTPYTRSFHSGVQREITSDVLVQADYEHRDIRNMLGVRDVNLAFEARIPGHLGQLQPGTGSAPIFGYGPWYRGRYDSISAGIRKRMSKRVTVQAFYTWANAVDNAFNSSFVSDAQTRRGAGSLAVYGPTDSFVGVPPVVTDPVTGKTNANGSFIASNGNPVPQAGKFYNGPDLDKGPSDLALTHTFLAHGIVQLPWQAAISPIFRAQSGFHFSAVSPTPADVDGDNIFNGVDFLTGRNHFQAPGYVNLDVRLAKRFGIGDRLSVKALVEFFNLLNRANPAAVGQLQNVPTQPLGKPLQYLPGREGQVGLRFEF